MKKSLYILKHKKLYKIGISNCTRRRHKEISKSLRSSKVKMIFSFAFWNSERLERFLHAYFSKHRVRHQGSGKTEYFKLGIVRAFFLVMILRFVSVFQLMLTLIAFLLMCVGVFTIFTNI